MTEATPENPTEHVGDESQGYGILQITETDEETDGLVYTRYLFDATAIIDKVTCAIPLDAVDKLDQQTFDDMMFDLSKLSDEEIGPRDEDRFFTAFFSADSSQ